MKKRHHNRGAQHHIRGIECMLEEGKEELVVSDGGGDGVQGELQPLHKYSPRLLWITMRVFGAISWRIQSARLV